MQERQAETVSKSGKFSIVGAGKDVLLFCSGAGVALRRLPLPVYFGGLCERHLELEKSSKAQYNTVSRCPTAANLILVAYHGKPLLCT